MFDWIVGLVEQTGSIGGALLMFAENVFPPIPSELIMPLAGFSAARGELHIISILFAGTIGSLLGALLWYYIRQVDRCAATQKLGIPARPLAHDRAR